MPVEKLSGSAFFLSAVLTLPSSSNDSDVVTSQRSATVPSMLYVGLAPTAGIQEPVRFTFASLAVAFLKPKPEKQLPEEEVVCAGVCRLSVWPWSFFFGRQVTLG